jgi:hypothetical protein
MPLSSDRQGLADCYDANAGRRIFPGGRKLAANSFDARRLDLVSQSHAAQVINHVSRF